MGGGSRSDIVTVKLRQPTPQAVNVFRNKGLAQVGGCRPHGRSSYPAEGSAKAGGALPKSQLGLGVCDTKTSTPSRRNIYLLTGSVILARLVNGVGESMGTNELRPNRTPRSRAQRPIVIPGAQSRNCARNPIPTRAKLSSPRGPYSQAARSRLVR
jgi:hypothetical protein